MIKLVVTYKIKENHTAQEFLSAIHAEGLDAASKAEPGNIRYDYYLPEADRNEVVLLEGWADNTALDAHKLLPHFQRIGEVKALYVEETVIERYEI